MTVEQIAKKACGRLNLQDYASIEKAKGYVRDRWLTIWNCHLWKDSIAYASVKAEMDGDRCILRVPLERVRNIRYGGYSIYPIDPSNVFQLDPQAFDNFGEVCGFAPLGKDENSNRIVQIFRPPRDVEKESFLVMGKKRCPDLADDEEPFLTGIEDAITEYVVGDMWQDDQQGSKAATAYSNGSSFLEMMRKIDGEQSAANPRFIPECAGQYEDLFDD